jgi:hypothetical protein
MPNSEECTYNYLAAQDAQVCSQNVESTRLPANAKTDVSGQAMY